MQSSLLGRLAFITGAGRGIGRSMSIALLRQGARVAMTSTDRASLIETLEASGVDHDHAFIVTGDLAQDAEIYRIIDEVKRNCGEPDILINNAGIAVGAIRHHGPGENVAFQEATPDILRHFFQINTIAPHIFATEFVDAMLAKRWGRIINISTSLDTMLKRIAYGGSKAALEAHSAMMAAQLQGSGVTVNVVVPGGQTATRMTEYLNTPAEQMLSPEVMVPPVLWLASRAADSVNGRRFVGALWDPRLPPSEAAKTAGAPVAWGGYGPQAILPKGNF